MMEALSSTLREKVEFAFGELASDISRWPWLKAVENWKRLDAAMLGDDPAKLCLSRMEHCSWKMLCEWVNGSYQHPQLSKSVINWMESFSNKRLSLSVRDDPLEKHRLKTEGHKSEYSSIILDLFCAEFLESENPKQNSSFGLYNIRSKATQVSSVQKIAFSLCFADKTTSLSTEDMVGQGSVLEPCPWLRREKEEEGLPFYLWDLQAKRTVIVGEIDDTPRYSCISHTWGRWRKDPDEQVDIENVPWKVPKITRFNVEELPNILASQCWMTPYVWIDLLCIPQDHGSKAEEEISRQAIIFRHSSFTVAWLNDIHTWTGTQGAVDWILASYMHDITDSPETAQLRRNLEAKANIDIELFPNHVMQTGWSIAKWISTTKDSPETARMRRNLEANINNVLAAYPDQVMQPGWYIAKWISTTKDFLLRYLGIRPNRAKEWMAVYQSLGSPAAWFTSLWTLQEACFCPDMILLNKDWQPLTTSQGTKVTLGNLISLDSSTPRHGIPSGKGNEWRDKWGSWPLGPIQLKQFVLKTRLSVLLDLSPRRVLALGNERECTSRRAEAIMSVLGITKWYKEYIAMHGHAPRERDMVLKTYPLSFVQEAAKLIGAQFFDAINVISPIFFPNVTGSMLPFTNPSGSAPMFHEAEFSTQVEDHRSIGSWEIKASGNVMIKRAGILASSFRCGSQPITATIYPSLKGEDVHDWLQKQPLGEVFFFVSLYRTYEGQKGSILRMSSISEDGQWQLIKVGSFKTENMEFPEEETVNWLVL